jgi:hypothetical protein
MNQTMTKQETTAGSNHGVADELESKLGKALVLIQRILPRLDDPARAAEIQATLCKASACLESARQLHELTLAPKATAGPDRVATGVPSEIAAVIAAAVAVFLDKPYRLVSVHQVETPVPYLNVWALEGRTQIFQSHKVR